MNSNLDSLSALIIAGFIITAGIRGNAKKLIDLAVRDKSFLKWFIALAILLYLSRTKVLGDDFDLILFMALFGLALNKSKEISDGFKKLWQFLGN